MTKYKGVWIHRNDGPGYRMRYWALTATGQVSAMTLAEIKQAINEALNQNRGTSCLDQ